MDRECNFFLPIETLGARPRDRRHEAKRQRPLAPIETRVSRLLALPLFPLFGLLPPPFSCPLCESNLFFFLSLLSMLLNGIYYCCQQSPMSYRDNTHIRILDDLILCADNNISATGNRRPRTKRISLVSADSVQ